MSSDTELAIREDETEDLTLLDDSAAIGKWELVETGLTAAKYSPEVAIRVCSGMKLRGADKKPLLYYDISYGGTKAKGLNAEVARALVSAVGNFEVVDVQTELGEWLVPKVIDGRRVVERVEAVRATARVRDGTTNNVTIGVVEEPLFGERSADKGGGWFARQHVADVARSKAIRNARLEHFAAVRGALLEAIESETRGSGEYFSGEPGALRGSEAQRDTILGEREALATIGDVRAADFIQRLSEFANTLEADDRRRLDRDLHTRLLPRLGCKLSTTDLAGVAEGKLEDAERWLTQMTLTLGGEEAPAAEPEATQPAVLDAPTPEIIRQTIKSLEAHDADVRKRVFGKTGIPESGDWSPEQAQELWNVIQAELKEAMGDD